MEMRQPLKTFFRGQGILLMDNIALNMRETRV
jgi:hypothetical protein